MNKTLVAPYAVRPVANAAVSAPIDWDELDDPELRPDRWNIKSMIDRVRERGDLFRPVLETPQELPAGRLSSRQPKGMLGARFSKGCDAGNVSDPVAVTEPSVDRG